MGGHGADFERCGAGEYCRLVLSVYCRFMTADSDIGSGEQRAYRAARQWFMQFLVGIWYPDELPPKQ